jgi:hypothetical protein
MFGATIKIQIGGYEFQKRVSIDRSKGPSECEQVKESLIKENIAHTIVYDTLD